MWVLDHLEDLESDFSVFHRVEDINSLDGPRFFRLALRIFAYEGVMAARLMQQDQDNSGSNRSSNSRGSAKKQVANVTQMSLMHPGLIERTVTKNA